MKYVVGARGSQLSVAQTNLVIEELKKANPDAEYEIKKITTKGDTDSRPLFTIDQKGIFEKEIDKAVAQKEVDFAIVENGKLKQIFECKITDDTISKNLKYFSEKYSIPGIQLINCEKNEYKANNCEVRNAKKFFSDTNQTLSKSKL